MIGTLVRDAAAYQAAFDKERAQEYPNVDAFEKRLGYAVNRAKLEEAARVLACPLKANPPNWQHGRVLYALTRHYLASADIWGVTGAAFLLDIGTAKGFSALCLLWALQDECHEGDVTSVDVIDPDARVNRNTVAEVDGPKTLREILRPWPESQTIWFVRQTGREHLTQFPNHPVHVAFVDGKHSHEEVKAETALLSQRQRSGDLVMWDDVQIPGVATAIKEQTFYDVEYLEILPHRKYAIGRRT